MGNLVQVCIDNLFTIIIIFKISMNVILTTVVAPKSAMIQLVVIIALAIVDMSYLVMEKLVMVIIKLITKALLKICFKI